MEAEKRGLVEETNPDPDLRYAKRIAYGVLETHLRRILLEKKLNELEQELIAYERDRSIISEKKQEIHARLSSLQFEQKHILDNTSIDVLLSHIQQNITKH